MKPRSLLIVGKSPPQEGNRRLPHHHDEVWTHLSVANLYPDVGNKATVIWDSHDLPAIEERWLPKLFDLRDPTKCTIPRERGFDYHEMTLLYGNRFSSQVAWMLGWAIECGFKHVDIFRSLTAFSQEYYTQVPDLYYFFGLMEGQGITIGVDPTSIMLHPGTYGLEVNS